jgi:phytoene dehydrogenase-like protein
MAVASPYFRRLALSEFGLDWVWPDLPLAHPLGGQRAVALKPSLMETADQFSTDARAYRRLMKPLVARWESLAMDFLQPLLHVPRHPLRLAYFARRAFRSAAGLANSWFGSDEPRALFGGLAAHSFLTMHQVPSAAFGLVLGMLGHAVGWPMPRGGAQRIVQALAGVLRSLGGEIRTGTRITSLAQLPKSTVRLLDVTPRQLLQLAGDDLPSRYRERLERFRFSPGVFKLDYALADPIPWRAELCRRAGTVHVGGSFGEIAEAEAQVAEGKIPERPFVLLAQPSLFDSSRAPEGKHIAWAYCHVPRKTTVDMTRLVENQIERFAPGFRSCILARHTANCAQLEAMNSNLVEGSIDGGASDWRQLIARPIFSATPYRVPISGVYLCSASTPPGAGVHGMCGFHAAEAAIRDWFS